MTSPANIVNLIRNASGSSTPEMRYFEFANYRLEGRKAFAAAFSYAFAGERMTLRAYG